MKKTTNTYVSFTAASLMILSYGMATPALAAGVQDTAAAYSEGGRYFTKDDIPTFNIGEDGTVDWPTYEGFRRYHSECHVCHGPEGEGSSYAPALKKSVMNMDYYDFLEIVAGGKEESKGGTEFVMPSFGTNKNVMCYIDDIYVYLRARGADAVPRGRPRKKEPKSDEIRQAQKDCLDG